MDNKLNDNKKLWVKIKILAHWDDGDYPYEGSELDKLQKQLTFQELKSLRIVYNKIEGGIID